MARVGDQEEKRGETSPQWYVCRAVRAYYSRGLRLRSRSSSGQAERENGAVRVMSIPWNTYNGLCTTLVDKKVVHCVYAPFYGDICYFNDSLL